VKDFSIFSQLKYILLDEAHSNAVANLLQLVHDSLLNLKVISTSTIKHNIKKKKKKKKKESEPDQNQN